MVFHWSVSDCKSPQITWTLFGILTDFNNAVVWIFSNLLLLLQTISAFADYSKYTNNNWHYLHPLLFISLTGFKYHYYYYYITACEIFLPALANSQSLESEWQDSSSLQDSSQHSGWQHYCNLHGIASPSDLQLLQHP